MHEGELAMAANDRTIVVGVKDYPSLGNLDGPENDARDFEAWLLDPTGGGVPQGNIKRILSSDFVATANPLDAEPTTVRLQRAFDGLYDLGEANGGKAGRRLYVYLAGHGVAPSLEDAALLMANAARGRSGYHISGRTYANWFRQSAFFDEIVLFMDCCRENSARAGVQPSPYDPLSAPVPAHHLYGFATEWSRASRERPIGAGGQIQGLFTIALLPPATDHPKWDRAAESGVRLLQAGSHCLLERAARSLSRACHLERGRRRQGGGAA